MKKKVSILALLFSVLFVYGSMMEVEANSDYLEKKSSFTNIVIFIKFANEDNYQAPYEFSYYEEMFNGVDMVSLRDYYLEVSYGEFIIDSVFTGTEIIFYQDEHERGYYMPYDSDTNLIGYKEEESGDREHNLLKNALDWVEENELIDDSIDIDVDNDGEIDSLSFLISGEDTGWDSLLWPHMWSFYSYYDYDLGDYTEDAPKINDKYAWHYTVELLGNNQRYENQVDVAVLAHETFHLLSAPDLYHYYGYDWIDPVGEWGLMASEGEYPSHMLGYMKYQYTNWMKEAVNINSSGGFTLEPLSEGDRNYYKIPLNESNEYIYIEYRKQSGRYESNLPGSGLLVYKVDEDYAYNGNEDGYYGTYESNEEVYVYRPNIWDKTYPITFPKSQPTSDVDGDIDLAALSQNNEFDEIGTGTDILLFDSRGNEVDVLITNIIEEDNQIKFSVFFNPTETPQIALYGREYIILDHGTEYEDEGFTVSDPSYLDNVVVESDLNTNELGKYNITYTIFSDSNEVIDEITREILVVDSEAPTVTLNPGVDTVYIGETWEDASIVATDNLDMDLDIEINSNVNTEKIGTYKVKYTVTDDSDNETIIYRYVHVINQPTIKRSDFDCVGKTTYDQLRNVEYPSCTLNGLVMDLDGTVSLKLGSNEVFYTVEFQNTQVRVRTFMFLLEPYEYKQDAYVERKEEELV